MVPSKLTRISNSFRWYIKKMFGAASFDDFMERIEEIDAKHVRVNCCDISESVSAFVVADHAFLIADPTNISIRKGVAFGYTAYSFRGKVVTTFIDMHTKVLSFDEAGDVNVVSRSDLCCKQSAISNLERLERELGAKGPNKIDIDSSRFVWDIIYSCTPSLRMGC